MTFEEFLTKKKIDLAQFKTAEPGLFLEFQIHYSQMGEKSFDHSKKFLFNKLRRAYHLKEELKPAAAKEIIEVNEIASQAEPLLSPTVEATVYTPRFRAGGTATTQEVESGKLKTETRAQEPENQTKPAYTPRFKAQTPKSLEVSPSDEANTAPAEPAKPIFKPRFKPGLTGTGEAKPAEEITEESPAEKPKPVYVPRFKAATVKSAEEPTQENTPDKPKPAYIPRFKAKPSPPPDTSDL